MYRWLVLIALVFTACGEKSEVISLNLEKNVGPDEIIDNLQMFATTGEKIEWQMTAGRTKRFLNDRSMIAYDVNLETLNMDDKNFYSSDSAYVYEIQDEFIGMGNVEIITPKGILRTDKIIWNRKTDRIHAPNEVYLKRFEHEMWGKNLHTNSNLDFINMERVSGKGIVDDDFFTDF